METKHIEKLRKIDTVVDKFADITDGVAELLRKECGLLTPEKMQEEIDSIYEEDRLLNIGIIGRVKAGKSSLLNALFFEGKQILPKAATPMTAALTILNYSEEPKAEIDFFTQSDISFLEKEHKEYKSLYDKLLAESINEAEKKEKEKKIPVDIERVKISVKNKLKNNPKLSSFEQYESIIASNKLSDLNNFSNIISGNIGEVMIKLEDYVGADGSYMPFTKSVTLSINNESLKDIQIVDTPGINDPIKSREQRTEEYLSRCDVVFVVSQSGDVLNKEDLNLMGHVSVKEGVNHIYLVASMADRQLHGSIKNSSGGVLPQAIDGLKKELVEHASVVFKDQIQSNPETRIIYESLLEDIENRVLITSAISHSMLLLWKKQNEWDEDMIHVWNECFKKNYMDYFTDSSAISSLELLSGIEGVKKNIESVRKNKEEIVKKRQDGHKQIQVKKIESYIESLKTTLQENKSRLETVDAQQLKEQKENKEKMRQTAALDVDDAFDESLFAFKTNLSSTLRQNSRGLFNSASDFSSHEKMETKTKTGMREKSSFGSGAARFFGSIFGTNWGYEQYSYTENVRTMQTAQIKRMLNDLVFNLEDDLNSSAEKFIMDWRKDVQNKTISALRQAINDDNLIDIPLLRNCIRTVINNLELPDFSLSSSKFSSNYSGIIKDDDIDEFINEAADYTSNLRQKYHTQIRTFLENTEKTAKKDNISFLLFKNMDKELEELEQELANKELFLSRYDNCIDELMSL